jgi:hypothetical protein
VRGFRKNREGDDGVVQYVEVNVRLVNRPHHHTSRHETSGNSVTVLVYIQSSVLAGMQVTYMKVEHEYIRNSSSIAIESPLNWASA